MFDINEELKKLPEKPGVYFMKDEHNNIIYIGKARILKNRVRQYFQSGKNKSPKILKMISLIDSFEYIITDSEMEALILECNLIKEYSPKYNTMLKDDKTYPYIKLTVGEPFPRLLSTRTMERDHSRYFGPFTAAKSVKDTIELLRKIYKIRACNKKLKASGNDMLPCLYHYINQCDAPCKDLVSTEAYKKGVEKALSFLNGKYGEVIEELKQKMYEASDRMEFEKAGEYKSYLDAVKEISQKQRASNPNAEDKDVIAVAGDGTSAVAQVFFIRDGKLIGREHFYLKNIHKSRNSELLADFIKQYYSGSPFVPKTLLLQYELEDSNLIGNWLSKIKGSKVHILTPKIGEKEKLVELAYKNARLVLNIDKERLKAEEARTIGAMKRLAELLGIPVLNRIEAYDISNISGTDSVGAMVVYEGGKPKRNAYRKFRIKTVEGPDDYASMYEIIKRRFRHIHDSEFGTKPDLILMDGGKGQIGSARKVLNEQGISDVYVCGMVKDDKHRTAGLIYKDKELFCEDENLMKFITNIQDEVHRFAITYHRYRRNQSQVHSVLDDISGIGKTRRLALLEYFGTVDRIREAEMEELLKVKGMNRTVAKKLFDFFR